MIAVTSKNWLDVYRNFLFFLEAAVEPLAPAAGCCQCFNKSTMVFCILTGHTKMFNKYKLLFVKTVFIIDMNSHEPPKNLK